MKHIRKFNEEISAEKVLSAERKHDDNFTSTSDALGVDGNVNEYGFDCVYIEYDGVKVGNFKATSVREIKDNWYKDYSDSKPRIVDLNKENYINSSFPYKKEEVIKVINGEHDIKAIFMKNRLCFAIPNIEGSKDNNIFRGWIKTNDRSKVVKFLKKWGLFNKVNINDIMLVADKLKNLQSLKQSSGEIKGSKKVTIDDVKNILKGDSENKAEDIMKLFGK